MSEVREAEKVDVAGEQVEAPRDNTPDRELFFVTLDEARSMWRLMSHDAHGLGEDGLIVKGVMRRLGMWVDERS